MKSLPPSVRQLCSRYRTDSYLAGHDHEHHDLASLARRVMLSQDEVLDQIEAGSLLAIDGPLNGRYLFSTRALDSVRSAVVNFIGQSIVSELSRRGADEETMLRACHRAFERQSDLSRGIGADLIEFGRDDDASHPVRDTAVLAGGAAAGYAGYRFLKNRKRNGTPALPGGEAGPDTDHYVMTPKPKAPTGSGGAVAGVEQHPDPVGARASLPAATSADPGLLGNAVRRGRKAIATRGGAILRALRNA